MNSLLGLSLSVPQLPHLLIKIVPTIISQFSYRKKFSLSLSSAERNPTQRTKC